MSPKKKYRGYSCSALGCRNKSNTSPYKFHAYPSDPLLVYITSHRGENSCSFLLNSVTKDPKTRNRWIKLARRTVEPGPGAYLCSCHFVDGKKENGPTLFAYNADKQLRFPSPERRTRKKTAEQSVDPIEVDTRATAWALAAFRPDMLDALERPPFKLSHQRMCSLHFEDNAYIDSVNLNRLKPFAIPSLFYNQQGELAHVNIDPEMQKLVNLKAAGIKVEADEFLKQVIRQTEGSYSTTEELGRFSSKKFKFEDQVEVKTEEPEINLTANPSDNSILSNSCNIRVKEVFIDYEHMCKIETFEFVPAASNNTIKMEPDLEEDQHGIQDFNPVAEADTDSADVICMTDIDPLETDKDQGHELSNSTPKLKPSVSEYGNHSSLHTTLEIKEEIDENDVVWITDRLETDQFHESNTYNVSISESETDATQHNTDVEEICSEMVNKEVQTPLELSALTAKEKKMQDTLDDTLHSNEHLREKLATVEDDLAKCLKNPWEVVTLHEYVEYTKTYFPDKIMAKFVLDLLDINQADHTKQKKKASEAMKTYQNNVAAPKLNSDLQKTVSYLTKQRKRLKSDNVNHVPPRRKEETPEVMKICQNSVASPDSSKDAEQSSSCLVMLRNKVKASIQPGVSKTWMDLLKIKADTFTDFQRPCVLYIDEIRLKPKMFYNIASDKLIGVSVDATTGDVVPTRYVTLVMAQGLCSDWRQPIAYHFSNAKCTPSRLKRMISENVHRLISLNLKVMALMCGTDSNYVQMAQLLGVSAERPYFWVAGYRIHFLFDVHRLSQHLWNCFLTIKMRFNGSVISWRYLKAYAELHPSVFPTKDSKLCKVSRNYRKRIFTEEMCRGLPCAKNRTDVRRAVRTSKFLSTIATFNKLMLDKTNMFLGTADERDPIDSCYDLLNRLQPVSKHTDASVCIKRWKVTVKSIASLWEDVRCLGFAHMFIPSRRCFSKFSQHLTGKKDKGFFDLQMTPIQFIRAFRNCFATELLDQSTTKLQRDTQKELYTQLLQATSLPQTNDQTKDDELNAEDTDYRSLEFPRGQIPSQALCGYLLDKCLNQHTCPLCLNYVDIQKKHISDNVINHSDISMEALETLYKPHRTFFSFVMGMDTVFRWSFKSAIVHSCVAKNLTGLLRKLSLVHPCLNFPFKYVTKLYARLRLYHTLKYLDDKIKCTGESFKVDDSVFME